MSCVKANASLVLSDLKASVSACRQAIASVSPEGSNAIADIDIEKAIRCLKVDLANSGVGAFIDRVGSSVSVVIKVICKPNTPEEESGYYLEIEPDTIWVYPDFEQDVHVYSNTDWIVE